MRIMVAGQSVELRGAQSDFECLEAEYSLFATRSLPEITVSVNVSENTTTADGPWGECVLNKNFMHFLDDASIGWCDFSLKQGRLSVLPGKLKNSLGTFLRNIVTVLLMRSNSGLLLHGAGIIHRQEALLFIGPSGAGKSTVASLSAGKPLISDENLFVKKEGERFACFTSPSWGEAPQSIRWPESVPVGKVFKLVQDTSVFVEPLSSAQAVAEVFTVPGLILPGHDAQSLLAIFGEFMERVPYYALHFRRDPSFWEHIESISCTHARA